MTINSTLGIPFTRIFPQESHQQEFLENKLQPETCQPAQNIFFLKTSKTGSQTMMAIMQRFGIRNNSTFLLSETPNGALSTFERPISIKKDCWIGKSTGMSYSMSTQHLKYNRTLIKNLMNPGSKYISIVREPTSNFVSSYRFYQNQMSSLWRQFGFQERTKMSADGVIPDEVYSFLFLTRSK